jgi:outer membrane protein assembly factor BamE
MTRAAFLLLALRIVGHRACAACAVALMVAGCSSVPSLPSIGGFGIYRVDVVQGNFISQETAALIRPGLSRAEVRDILGTPLVASALHANRWDYAFTLIRDGNLTQQYRYTVFFNGERVSRTEGTDLPPEKDFVAAIAPRVGGVALPEVSEEVQKRFAEATARPLAVPPAPSPAATSYPPLEPASARGPAWDTPVPRAPARPGIAPAPATPASPR